VQVIAYYLAGVLLDRLVKGSQSLSFQFLRDLYVKRRHLSHPCRASVIKRRMFKVIGPKVSSILILLDNFQAELVGVTVGVAEGWSHVCVCVF